MTLNAQIPKLALMVNVRILVDSPMPLVPPMQSAHQRVTVPYVSVLLDGQETHIQSASNVSFILEFQVLSFIKHSSKISFQMSVKQTKIVLWTKPADLRNAEIPAERHLVALGPNVTLNTILPSALVHVDNRETLWLLVRTLGVSTMMNVKTIRSVTRSEESVNLFAGDSHVPKEPHALLKTIERYVTATLPFKEMAMSIAHKVSLELLNY